MSIQFASSAVRTLTNFVSAAAESLDVYRDSIGTAFSELERAIEREREALFACACLFQGNLPKNREADVVFLPGLAVDNWQDDTEDDGILKTAAALCLDHAHVIAIPGNRGTRRPDGSLSETGYPGGERWKAELLALGISPEWILPYALTDVGPDGKSWNTRTEIDDFIRIAQTGSWRHAIVLATPFHLPRVMLTLVKALNDARYRIELYPVTPRSVSWTKRVYHSQGLQQLPRYQHLREEWSRIPKYQEKGSICSFRELYEYLIASSREGESPTT